MSYFYLKAYPKLKRASFGQRHARVWRLLPWSLVTAGLALLISVIGPVVAYQIKSGDFTPKIVSPMTVSAETEEYLQPANWFVEAPVLPPRPSLITTYSLSIPKLGIKEAAVEIGGKDLGKAMVHYSGTALPGQLGSAVIFCHSVLPQFFNPQNYKTICSTLPTLKKGDAVGVSFDGIEYRYRVYQMLEVPPEDVTVLEQHYDNSYLSLVTCVPPGTYLRRLIVRAELVRI
ncbi:MAG: sortase [Candidatus Shapirobacteria bacterium]